MHRKPCSHGYDCSGYLKLDPFEVWGDGEQIRNWTYVEDIVSGTIAAAENIHDGTSINLGTMERIKVKDCAQQVIDTLNPGATIKLLTDKPTGPLNRVASNSLAQELLDWSPQTNFQTVCKKQSIGMSAPKVPSKPAQI